MGRSKRDGLFEIVAHAHGQLAEAVAVGQFAQKGEMERRCFVDWWDTHKALHWQVEITAFFDERVGVCRGDPGFLRLFPCVYSRIGKVLYYCC